MQLIEAAPEGAGDAHGVGGMVGATVLLGIVTESTSIIKVVIHDG
jgi:hypothetical protein